MKIIGFWKGKTLSEEHRRKLSESHKGRKLNFFQKHKDNLSKSLKGKYTKEKNAKWKGGKVECKCLICKGIFYKHPSKIRRGHGKYCSLSCTAISVNKRTKKKGTDIEQLIEIELCKRQIPFNKQIAFPEAHTVVDFLLPNNIIIYVDDKYWHCDPEFYKPDYYHKSKIMYAKDIWENNLIKNIKLKNMGYKVFRFWDREIKASPSACIDKILHSK